MDRTRSGSMYVVMGVCGCGKSSVASRLAESFGIEMLDADDFHPPENVAKMSEGKPLTDHDRAGWLQRLNAELRRRQDAGKDAVLACSALKQRYRDVLQEGIEICHWIYLKGDRDLILERMSKRSDHFMPTTLVDSQLATLEEPDDAVVVDISQSLDEIHSQLLAHFKNSD